MVPECPILVLLRFYIRSRMEKESINHNNSKKYLTLTSSGQ